MHISVHGCIQMQLHVHVCGGQRAALAAILQLETGFLPSCWELFCLCRLAPSPGSSSPRNQHVSASQSWIRRILSRLTSSIDSGDWTNVLVVAQTLYGLSHLFSPLEATCEMSKVKGISQALSDYLKVFSKQDASLALWGHEKSCVFSCILFCLFQPPTCLETWHDQVASHRPVLAFRGQSF